MQHDATLTNHAPPLGAAGGILLRTAFSANFPAVREAIASAKVALEPLELTEEEVTSVELVLAEALNNIVEHAYSGDEGTIRMVLRHGRAGVLIEVRDNGRAMPNGRAPIGDHPMEKPEANSDDLPEGGFGWFLIRELARDLIYDRADNENFLVFRLAIGKRN